MTRAEFGAIARLARRTARRAWKRTTLIVVLIAIPVAASIITAGVMRANAITEDEQIAERFGGGDYAIQISGDNEAIDEWVRAEILRLAPSATIAELRSIPALIAAGEPGRVTDLDPTSPLAEGRSTLIDGRVPGQRGEVALPAYLSDLLGVGVGDTVRLLLGDTEYHDLVVTGIVGEPLRYKSRLVVVAPEQLDDVIEWVRRGEPFYDDNRTWLVASGGTEFLVESLENSWEAARRDFLSSEVVAVPPELSELSDTVISGLSDQDIDVLLESVPEMEAWELEELAWTLADNELIRQQGDIYVESKADELRFAGFRPDFERRLAQPQVIATLVAALLLAEVALVAGAAYATGTRRRLHEIGLLGANGATEAHLRTMVIGEGMVAGIVGSALGAGLAIAVMTAGQPLLQPYLERLITGVPLTVLDVAGPTVVGVMAATAAAWLPARTASRVPTVTALQGRMPLRAPHRGTPVVGIGISLFGTLLLIIAKADVNDSSQVLGGAGVILMIAGAVFLIGPLIAWTGGFANQFRATPRLVLRDSARQRTRAAAAVAAIMVVLIAPVVVGITIRNTQARDSIMGLRQPENHVVVMGLADFEATPVDVTAADTDRVQSILAPSRAAMMDVLDTSVVFAAEFPLLDSGDRLPDAGYDILDVGRAAIGTSDIADALGDPAIATEIAAGNVVVLGTTDRATSVVLGGQKVPAVEIEAAVLHWSMPRILVPQKMVTDQGFEVLSTRGLIVTERNLTNAERHQLATLPFWISEWNSGLLDPNQGLMMTLGITLLVVLGIIALVTALAATESDHDVRLMVAVGAPPSMRRRFLGLQTGFYVLTAALIGVPVGWLLMKVALPDSNEWIDYGPFGVTRSDLVTVPWMVMGFLVFVMPLLVGGLTALLARSSPTMPPQTTG